MTFTLAVFIFLTAAFESFSNASTSVASLVTLDFAADDFLEYFLFISFSTDASISNGSGAIFLDFYFVVVIIASLSLN